MNNNILANFEVQRLEELRGVLIRNLWHFNDSMNAMFKDAALSASLKRELERCNQRIANINQTLKG